MHGDGNDPCLDLAYHLTNTLPVVMPSVHGDQGLRPIIVQHGKDDSDVDPDHEGGMRYDAIVADRDVDSPYWSPPLLPMAHIMVGMKCNNRCVYCNVQGGDHQTLYETGHVKTLIDHAASVFLAEGPCTADFIGGEPTLHPELAGLVAWARDRGFEAVTVCTNGRRLTRPGYLDSLVDAGLTGIRYSMHHHLPDVAGELAGRPSEGGQYIETALELLSREDVITYFYRIVLSRNIDSLADHLEWLAAHNRTSRPLKMHLGLPSPRGRLFEEPGLFPDLRQARDAIARAVELSTRLGIEITLYHSPGCLYPEGPERAAILHLRTMQIDAGTNAVTRLNFEGDTRLASACDRCAEHDRCCGLAEHYFKDDPEAVESWVVPLPVR